MCDSLAFPCSLAFSDRREITWNWETPLQLMGEMFPPRVNMCMMNCARTAGNNNASRALVSATSCTKWPDLRRKVCGNARADNRRRSKNIVLGRLNGPAGGAGIGKQRDWGRKDGDEKWGVMRRTGLTVRKLPIFRKCSVFESRGLEILNWKFENSLKYHRKITYSLRSLAIMNIDSKRLHKKYDIFATNLGYNIHNFTTAVTAVFVFTPVQRYLLSLRFKSHTHKISLDISARWIMHCDRGLRSEWLREEIS